MTRPNEKFNKQAANRALDALAVQPENMRPTAQELLIRTRDVVSGVSERLDACDMFPLDKSMDKLAKSHPEQAGNVKALKQALAGKIDPATSPTKCGRPVME